MTNPKPPRLLATGGIRTVAATVPVPVLYWFPPSFNAGKATLATQISQKGADVVQRLVLIIRDNYKPEYARLNPDTMAVPSMEIDDKVITDSYDIVKYLYNTYPGPGDKEVQTSGRSADLWTFVDLAVSWDEYMFTYGNMGTKMSDMANNIRLANLRFYLRQTLTEKPDDEESLVSAYINKIAGIMAMNRATGGEADAANKQRDMEANRQLLDEVFAAASTLLGSGSGFLFGDKLTTADACFLPIFRIFVATDMAAMFDETFAKYPNLRGYWERAQANTDVQESLLKCLRKRALAYTMLKLKVPKTILAYKTGLLKPPRLPEDVEERISEAAERKWQEVRGQ